MWSLLSKYKWYDKIILISAILGFLAMWVVIMVFWFNHSEYTKMMLFKEFWVWYIIMIPTMVYCQFKILK